MRKEVGPLGSVLTYVLFLHIYGRRWLIMQAPEWLLKSVPGPKLAVKLASEHEDG